MSRESQETSVNGGDGAGSQEAKVAKLTRHQKEWAAQRDL